MALLDYDARAPRDLRTPPCGLLIALGTIALPLIPLAVLAIAMVMRGLGLRL